MKAPKWMQRPLCQVLALLEERDRDGHCSPATLDNAWRIIRSFTTVDGEVERHVKVYQAELPATGKGVEQPRATKKPERIKDPALLERYRLEHPVCEVAGPDCEYDEKWTSGALKPQVHHIIEQRKEGGDDVESNLASLCAFHHSWESPLSWHRLKPVLFVRRYRRRMTPAFLKKVIDAGLIPE